MFVCVLALAGCSSRQAVSTTTTVTTTSETTTTVAPLPALGETVGIFLEDRGFGEVKPSQFFNGGDTAGLVQHIRWKSWGGPEAVGTGLSEYVAPNQDVTEGRSQPATVVAFKLGTCFGNFIYQAIEWYFPEHAQRFNPSQYENVCSGSFVTSTATAPSCPPSHIQAKDGPFVGGATGEQSMTIALVNSGPGTCMLSGYPRVRLVTAAGTTLDFARDTQSQYIRRIPPRRVVLSVGAIAYVEIAKYRCDLGDAKAASQIRLSLPEAGEDTALSVPAQIEGYCKGGPTDPGNFISFTPVESNLGAALP